MAAPQSFTLTEIARRLEVPQHRLIHLCEQGVVVPEVHDAAGRGSSRVFSPTNFLELAVALRLRDMMLPVSAVRGIVHVLHRFAQAVPSDGGASLVERLRAPNSPEVRVIVSDGEAVYFTLGAEGKTAKLFGGIPLEALMRPGASSTGPVEAVSPVGSGSPQPHRFGGLEGSQFARMELSVNAVARALPLD